MTAASLTALPTQWRKPPFIRSAWMRYTLWMVVAVYLAAALGTVEINWERVAAGIPRVWQFFSAMLAPDFITRSDEIMEGLLESVSMTVTATAIGILLSVPVGLGAARNLAPLPVYLVCRAIISVSRTFQEIIIAILFIKMFGFGPFAGVVTLAFATIGFMGKLLAERIEAVDVAPLEAIRATGAGWLQWVNYAIQPQVMPRLVGLTLYRLDINFREAAVLGIVGAGGIGATLNTALSRYEYDTAAAILLSIIAIVLVAEYVSSFIRKRLQ